MNPGVAKVFDTYPDHVRPQMVWLRELILDVAANTDGVGPLEETLKWGEPAYLTSKSGSGTTLRIDWKEKSPEHYALYVNCNTTLVDSFGSLFASLFAFEGKRAIVFSIGEPVPENELRLCIQMALRYHLDKKK